MTWPPELFMSPSYFTEIKTHTHSLNYYMKQITVPFPPSESPAPCVSAVPPPVIFFFFENVNTLFCITLFTSSWTTEFWGVRGLFLVLIALPIAPISEFNISWKEERKQKNLITVKNWEKWTNNIYCIPSSFRST